MKVVRCGGDDRGVEAWFCSYNYKDIKLNVIKKNVIDTISVFEEQLVVNYKLYDASTKVLYIISTLSSTLLFLTIIYILKYN